MSEKCSELEDNLAGSGMENNELKEKLTELEHKLYKTQQEIEAISEQKIALEERTREQQDEIEREMASDREQKKIYENKLQAKTQEFEEGRTLLKLKENCLSKVEAELAETKESYKQLMQENLTKYEVERGNMIKEINGLRCLQEGKCKAKPKPKPKQDAKEGFLSGEQRAPNLKKNNKLNSELTRAKEQLVRLKAELTLSNVQTRHLGSQLSSLREDSTKLEAELSTAVRSSPKNSQQRRNSFSCYDETVRLEIELAEAKERIIDLQEKLLSIYKEKFALEEKIMSLEEQRNSDMQDAGHELVTLEDEQLRLKCRLKKWAQNTPDEQHVNAKTTTANKTIENNFHKELRDLSAENFALQEETNALKETIAELECDLTALKLKVSIKDTMQEATVDKKAVATLLVSVKQERAELQKALDDVLMEKDDLGEELADIKIKYARIQREYAMTSMIKDDLELEVLSLKKANLTRGLSNLTQSSEECRSEMSDSSIDDLMFCGNNEAVDASAETKKIGSPGGGRKRVNGVNNRKAVTVRNHRESCSSSSNGSADSSSKCCSPEKRIRKESILLYWSAGAPPSGPSREALGTSPPRFIITNDNQSTNDIPQHPAISYDLIRIDDVNDEALHADTDCTVSGLVRETPKGERENPEGMEHDGSTSACFDTDDKSTHIDTEDKSVMLLGDTVEVDEHWSSNKSISETDSTPTQSAEVLVKTAWSVKNLFRRQKSLPLPDHKLGALKQ
ncbi:hypothetical protein OS493_024450 [Desmophyllum pertusum]|uniref:Uncharacterized protein n=1 Tax=Desmophyllum pertusum TaxID=174260 RepID=A0A9X0CFC2_9CNID|nr:hypothetical protein OS493_024450 [Desmophyllum pertusum]